MSFGEGRSLSARPRVRCLCPPGKTQHLLPKSVFDRPGSDRRNLASTTFPDAGPMVRIRFPPARSLVSPVPSAAADPLSLASSHRARLLVKPDRPEILIE